MLSKKIIFKHNVNTESSTQWYKGQCWHICMYVHIYFKLPTVGYLTIYTYTKIILMTIIWAIFKN
jgi:hypothetical protein